MNRKDPCSRMAAMGRIMTAVGLLGALLVVALRVWIKPAMRDTDTGLFSTNKTVMILMLVMLGILAAIVFVVRGGTRREIQGKPSLILAVMTIAVGAALAFTGVADVWTALRDSAVALPTTGVQLPNLLAWMQRICGLLSGVALVRFGLLLASEGSTRRGMAQWSLLAPVLWMWLVLAGYVMSYNSMVRPVDGFFTLMAYVSELLFLLYFARYMAGVGKVGSVTMLLFSCSATLFAVSTPAVKLLLSFMGDHAEYTAAGPTGMLDLAIGLLALVVSVTLCQSLSTPVEKPAEEEESVSWSSEQEAEVELIESVAEEDEA